MGISLTRFLIEQQRAHGRINADLRLLIEVVARACKAISVAVGKGALAGHLGSAETENVQGETQKKLDVISNEILLEANEWGGHLAAIASEEMDDPHPIPNRYPKGEYLLVFDPLDGSSNIDVNVAVGTIFSVLRCPEGTEEPNHQSFCQYGHEQVAAGYAIYGPSTELVLTLGNGVYSFTLDREAGSFRLVRSNIQIPVKTAEFAINMSNQRFWEKPMQDYVAHMQAGKTGPLGKDYNMRWVASMVADVHRIITRGGIFMYPFDYKDPSKAGRLRLLYEASPMAMIIEQAGGAASTGRARILDLKATALHQRVAVILGSREEVERAIAYHAQFDLAAKAN